MDTQHDDPVCELAERVARLDPPLPELTRRRLLVAIHARIDGDQRRAVRGGYALAAFVLLAAASAVLGWWQAPAPQVAVTPRSAPVVVRPPTALPAAAPAPSSASVLVPYLVSGMEASRAAELLDHAQSSLVLAARERVLATLADRARIALRGPAELRVISSDPRRVVIELLHGTLLGDYDHGGGGELRVRAPGMVSEIVGTVFMVDAQRTAARTAVLHGTVRVQVAGKGTFTLHDRQALSGEDGALSALDPSDSQALRAHERSVSPPGVERGVLAVAGPSLNVEIDGGSVVQTPLWLSTAPGRHRVALRGPGERTRTLEAQVRVRERSELTIAHPTKTARGVTEQEAVGESDAQIRAEPASAADLYRAAEAAMRDRDTAAARALLAQLIELHPEATEIDLALYELAELSLRAADYQAVELWLTRLEQLGPRAALRASVSSMRCRLLRARGEEAAHERCVAEFRARFPASSQE